MKTKIISLIFSLLAVMSCFASEVEGQQTSVVDSVYTIEQCVQRALEYNKAVKRSHNNIDAAIELRREAFTKYFPEISAVGLAFWANHHVLSYNLLDIIELGIIKNGKTAGIQALQPVFLGGQIVNGNKLAALGEEVARLRQQQTLDEVRLTTETLFWKLTSLKSTRETLLTAVSTLDSVYSQVQAALDAGIVMPNDLLKVKIKKNGYRSDLEDLDNGIQLVKMLLGQYIGLGPVADFDILSDVSRNVGPFPDEYYVDPAVGVVQMTDYQLLSKNVEAKRLEKRIEIGKNLPVVAVGGGWYYHDLLKQDHNFWAVQIGVAVPLSGWWGGSHAIKRKNLELQNAISEQEDFTEKLQIDLSNKWNTMQTAYRKLEIASESISEAAENLRLNRLYFEAGISTVTQLLEAQTAYTESVSSYSAAYGEFQTATSAYLIAVGK